MLPGDVFHFFRPRPAQPPPPNSFFFFDRFAQLNYPSFLASEKAVKAAMASVDASIGLINRYSNRIHYRALSIAGSGPLAGDFFGESSVNSPPRHPPVPLTPPSTI